VVDEDPAEGSSEVEFVDDGPVMSARVGRVSWNRVEPSPQQLNAHGNPVEAAFVLGLGRGSSSRSCSSSGSSSSALASLDGCVSLTDENAGWDPTGEIIKHLLKCLLGVVDDRNARDGDREGDRGRVEMLPQHGRNLEPAE
jgi:hypothetical protein